MQRYSKILQTKVNVRAVTTALICVVFLLVGSVVSAYAITPPPKPTTSDYRVPYISTYGQGVLVSLASIQESYGSFNNMRPLIMVAEYSGSTVLPVLYFSYAYTNEYIDIIASQTVLQNSGSSAREYSKLTPHGFGLISYTFTPMEFSADKVIAYRDSNGNFRANSEFFAQGASAIELDAVYQEWVTWINSGEGSGEGPGGDSTVVYELDIGSIITALPQAARNIIDSTFGFELFGINVAATLSCILLLAIVVFVVKWLMAR